MSADATTGACVLVVDDHDDSRELLATLLELRGFAVHTAGDAVTALATARAEKPQVAVIDIGLPGMDGHELARRLRSVPELSSLMIIALSGYGTPADKAKSSEAGVDHHLVKPADIGELVRRFDLPRTL